MIRYETKDAIARITLNAPPINVLTLDLIDEFLIALCRARDDIDVRAVVISSAIPRFFSAGLDIKALQHESGDGITILLDRLYLRLCEVQSDLGKPSIAAVTGAARGGGMTLAISCNVIVAGASATFGYPEINVGLLPAIHFVHLPRIIGRHRAFELLFTGRAFGADEAQHLGLVSRIVRDEDVVTEALALARTFADKSPMALMLGHRAFMRANDMYLDVAKTIEPFREAATSMDGREAMRAFVEKRPPRFS